MEKLFIIVLMSAFVIPAFASQITCSQPNVADAGFGISLEVLNTQATLIWGQNSFSGGKILGTDQVIITSKNSDGCRLIISSKTKSQSYFEIRDFNRSRAKLIVNDAFSLGASELICDVSQSLATRLCAVQNSSTAVDGIHVDNQGATNDTTQK